MREGPQFHPVVRTLLLSACLWSEPRLLTFSDQKILGRIPRYSLELRCYSVMNEITATPVVNESKLSDSAQTQTKHTGSDPARARWCAPSPWQRWQQGAPAQRRQVASAQIGCTCRTSVAPHCQRSVHMQTGVERDACDHAFADRFRACTTDDTRLSWPNSAYMCALR